MKEHIKNQTFRADKDVWKIPRLMKLAEELEPFDLPLKHMNIHNLYPAIESTMEFVEHIQYVLDADLDTPIILDEEGYVMDGRHRLAKALLEKKETIKAVRFEVTPTCCFTEV
ncbi:MAG: hypothetical protein DRP02_11810 [Candidatus Gerdarchaeota archaeon]|nr:MAG: hypothetical protein DRP02_11810 [Candidatus Gerdarchaeota archaeon]